MSKLSSILQLSARLKGYLPDTSGVVNFSPLLCDATRLREQAVILGKKFDEGKPAEPPSRERVIAIQKLRQQSESELTQKDWIRVAWGLCDQVEPHSLGMLDDLIMRPLIERLAQQKNTQSISRKLWFGLLHSYFSFDPAIESVHPYWEKLRDLLHSSLPVLISSQTRPKAWVKALIEHQELLTDKAGSSLVDEVFTQDASKSIELLEHFSIPESSWLWQRVIHLQIEKLKVVADEQFFDVIPNFIKIADSHALQADELLIGLLSRYEQSGKKDQAHKELKDFALSHWGNPQIKSSSRWGLVSGVVRKMVLQWFAKEDLQLFFSLLQGVRQVDQARLTYWLKYVHQIDYTRIVIGIDTMNRVDSDFVDYRNKNQGRYSRLVGGATSNNAFIMRIGQYYFVEFSGTSNACYVYDETRLEFDVEASVLDLNRELKVKRFAVERIVHNSGWERATDIFLAKLGIHQNPKSRVAVSKPTVSKPTELEHNVNREVYIAEKETLQDAISVAIDLTSRYSIPTSDDRSAGGVFWVVYKQYGDVIGKRLISLGFKYSYGRGYWLR